MEQGGHCDVKRSGPGVGGASTLGEVQGQEGEGLCGVESEMVGQRQLSPENMVVVWGGVGV